MHFIKNCLIISFLVFLAISCATIPPNTHQTSERIATGVGPEDLLLDTISSPFPRLLVSCMDHRLSAEAPNGAIYAINLDQDPLVSYPLKRINEPDGHDFHPHGFDIVRRNDKTYLFVVSHDEKKEKHFVYKYELLPNAMKFVVAYENALINSPNTVVALKKNGFYVSNDQGKRGDRLAAFLRAKTGSIVYCDEQKGWARVASKLAFPNGLYISPKERYLYASTTRQHQIFKFGIKSDGNLISREKVTSMVGGDNIRLGQDKKLLIPSHLRIFKFVGHFKDSTKLSPSVVYGLNTTNGEKEVVYSNDGQQINAASTALSYNEYIYISQVFQPFVLRVKKKK